MWHRLELRVYCCPVERIARLPRVTTMRRDCLEDLEHYEATDADQMAPEAYREAARQRRAQGHHLYTAVEDGRLVQYGWLIDRQARGEDAALGQVFFPPPDSAALYDHYTHPRARGRGLHFAGLCQRLHDAVDLAGAQRAFTYVYSGNTASRRGVERAGFEHVGSLVTERRLLMRRRYTRPVARDFKSGLL